MNLFEFMSGNPFLTFFIIIGIGMGLESVLKHVAIMIRGYSPYKNKDEEN